MEYRVFREDDGPDKSEDDFKVFREDDDDRDLDRDGPDIDRRGKKGPAL